MIEHLKEMRSKITLPAVSDENIYLWFAPPHLDTPYVILSSPADSSGGLRLSGVRDAVIDTWVRVKVVASTPEAAVIILGQIKTQIVGLLSVPGRISRVRWVRSDFIGFEEFVDPVVGTPAAIGVDTYQLISREG